MEEKTYYLVNGFASGEKFVATLESAKEIAIANSKSMNTKTWLYEVGVSQDIGHTEKIYRGYGWYWKFVKNS